MNQPELQGRLNELASIARMGVCVPPVTVELDEGGERDIYEVCVCVCVFVCVCV